jgi:hypothetical protein
MTITDTTMRTWRCQGESCVKRIVVHTNGRRVQRHRVLLRASGLSAFHKRRFKGSHLPIVCKTQLLKFNRNEVVFCKQLPFMWGIVGNMCVNVSLVCPTLVGRWKVEDFIRWSLSGGSKMLSYFILWHLPARAGGGGCKNGFWFGKNSWTNATPASADTNAARKTRVRATRFLLPVIVFNGCN